MMHVLFRLDADHALAADDHQWIPSRRRSGIQDGWKPLAYIASDKTILLSDLLKHGIQPTPAAQAKLTELPDRFSDWRAEQKNISKTCDVDPRDRGPP